MKWFDKLTQNKIVGNNSPERSVLPILIKYLHLHHTAVSGCMMSP